MSKVQEAETGRPVPPALREPVGNYTPCPSHKSETQAGQFLV